MPKKVRRPSPEEEESEDDSQFVVEVIKAARVSDGQWEFLVKWANYPSDDDTWEPADNLECQRLLDSFWENVGLDDNDYYEGYVVKATPSWIKREKKFFARTLGKQQSEDSDEGEDEPMPSTSQAGPPSIKKKGKAAPKQPAGKKRNKAPKIKLKKERIETDEESSDHPPSSTRTKGKKKAKMIIASSDEAEEDDQPLANLKKAKTTITIPPARRPENTQKDINPHHSDSAGSLFSEKEVSSPEVALRALPPKIEPTAKGTKIPMKRPSVDDAASSQQRKRQIKEMPMQITGTAGNSTKARLAQRIPPTAVQTTPALPHPSMQKLDLSKLSFRKNSAVTAGSPVQAGSPVVPSPTIPPLPRRSASTSDHAQSPAPAGRGSPVLETHTAEPRWNLPLPRRQNSGRVQPPIDPLAEANKFLSDMMPAQIASPMQEDAVDIPPPPVSIRSAQTKASTLPRIQKKWKWTGELFMDVSRERAERVCEIMLSDVTEPLQNGLRFNLCLTGDSIRLSALQNLSSLHLFLSASARAQQFAKLGPLAEKDADAVKNLGEFMKKNSLFSFAHLYLDNNSVALLVIFPTGHEIPTRLLKVPPALSGDTSLQAALVPWELTTKEFRIVDWKKRSPTVERSLDREFVKVLDAAGHSVPRKRRLYQALHILGFPKHLYDLMSKSYSPRNYCIWNGEADNTSTGSGYETSLLKDILTTCPSAKDVGLNADVRAIFVHVGSLATLVGLPVLAERRSKHPELSFITYGTHPSVPRDRWGVREIYLLGGIVTFTPSAVIEGHWQLFNRMEEIADHPTWACYVLPSVVAMVAKLTCQGLHPLRVYDEGNFVYEDLLKAIEQGTIALLLAPQLSRDPPPKDDPSLLWTRWMLRLPSMNARQILEECLNLAAEQFANTSDAELPVAIEREIVHDLRRMQSLPAIMDSYRRFVVLRTKSDTYLMSDKYGVECTTLKDFDFKDDYYHTTSGDSGLIKK